MPHSYLVTVRVEARALCTAGCSSLVGYDTGPLADHYRHLAVVAAERTTEAHLGAATPVAWYTLLQSDGLSDRSSDYLPALLRYGARAYGRDTASEAPAKLTQPVPFGVPYLAPY